jgi:threonine/homoserine/homoserine lactone efflux protein
MGDAIGQMLASAVGIAISPLPIIAIVLMLATPRGRANGIAFALGWVVSLAVMVAIVVLLGGGRAATGGEPDTWTQWLKLILGLAFLALAAKQWADRPERTSRPASSRGCSASRRAWRTRRSPGSVRSPGCSPASYPRSWVRSRRARFSWSRR